MIHCLTQPILQIETTNRCDKDCKFCLRNTLNSEGGDLSFENSKASLDQRRFKYVTLHGWGEPLLNKDLFKMIRYAKSKKVSTNFNTNAMLLSENTDKILDSGMDAIAFSVSTVKNMNKEMFDDIQYLVKKKESRRLKKPKTFFNVVVMPENYEEMPKILYLARDTGVDAVNFERLFPTERYIPKRDEEVLFSEIKRIGRESRIKIYLPPKHSIPCRLIKYALFVRWNGNVAPCCYLADVYLGNIIKESLSKISNRIKAFRKNIRDHPICSKCIT